MWLFDQNGFDNALRISHVIVGVMWMGLLWFFNFVQVPAYAEMDAAARNNALDKLTWRALWWFRWAAAATRRVRHPDHRGRGPTSTTATSGRARPGSRCCSASSWVS